MTATTPAPWVGTDRTAVTGLGPLPGTDPLEAARVVAGELGAFPHLPQLPARGPSGSSTARSAVLLVDLHVDLQPSGWRIVDRPGLDEHRAAAALGSDLDAAEEVWDGYRGPFKVQVDGPFSLAVAVDRPRGDAVLADSGARRDVAASLTEGLLVHVGDVRRRIPGASPVVQIDEPLLSTVLAGGVPTSSGFGRLRAVTDAEVRETFRRLADALAPVPLVVSVGARVAAPSPDELPPTLLWSALDGAGLSGFGVDPAALGTADLDRLAALVESGVTPWLASVRTGSVPGGPAQRPDAVARAVVDLWDRLGFRASTAAADMVVTPDAGLAALSPAEARRVMSLLARVGRAVAEEAATRS